MLERIIEKPNLTLADDFCVIDIETAGLVRQRDPIYILGILSSNGGPVSFHQLAFGKSSPDDEVQLLAKLKDIGEGKTWLTYNGNTFDIPYIETRLAHHGLDPISFDSLDLYPWIRTRRKFFSFPRLNLKTLETYAGIERQDLLSGAEVAAAYGKIDQDSSLLEHVLLHNEEDVLSTYQLHEYFQTLRDSLTMKVPVANELKSIELVSYQRDKDFAFIEYQSDESLEIPWQKQNSFGRITWEDEIIRLRVPCHLGKVAEDSEEVLEVGVLQRAGQDQSPYQLRAPLIVMADKDRVYVENLHRLVGSFFGS